MNDKTRKGRHCCFSHRRDAGEDVLGILPYNALEVYKYATLRVYVHFQASLFEARRMSLQSSLVGGSNALRLFNRLPRVTMGLERHRQPPRCRILGGM
jgi:hypothetical protein